MCLKPQYVAGMGSRASPKGSGDVMAGMQMIVAVAMRLRLATVVHNGDGDVTSLPPRKMYPLEMPQKPRPTAWASAGNTIPAEHAVTLIEMGSAYQHHNHNHSKPCVRVWPLLCTAKGSDVTASGACMTCGCGSHR